jgi:hypothetical protein
MGVGRWSTPRPGRITPGKTQYPMHRRLAGPKGQSGRVRKISSPLRFDPRTVQPVASRYTDCAIPALCMENIVILNVTNVMKILLVTSLRKNFVLSCLRAFN